ncbi:spiroplasma phage ORF1-like family protein, partial [Spiroplasma phoeniceum]|uniref:spiroplasma phage ORF1-like family protein n=1 Tax=Spiroplasma phoeniceum TaxID=47835 RepID=UPI003364DFAA
QYNINKFYDVDKKQFLRELTNLVYSFANKYNLTSILNKLKTNINDLQQVNLIEDNWKLVTDMSKEKGVIINKNVFEDVIVQNGKHYFVIFRLKGNEIPWKIYKLEIGKPNSMPIYSDGLKDIKAFYRWDGVSEPQIPTINPNTGKITDWNVDNQNKVKDFLNNYLDVIIQENIRVRQGGNPDYDSSIVGTQRIIFDFEIVNNLDKSSTGIILTKKSIYRMILTIDEYKNIIAGSLELTHLKQYWNGYDYNSYWYTDDLGFLFSFMKDKENIFNFSAQTYNYYQGNTPNTGKHVFEHMKGQIDINKFLKAFFAYSLVPVFQNRSNFIESGYIDNLQYDTVLINFFGLKLENFKDVILDENGKSIKYFDDYNNYIYKFENNKKVLKTEKEKKEFEEQKKKFLVSYD